jgi:hypothetical protein
MLIFWNTNWVPDETPSSWQDPEAPWWAKLRRAARLIKEVKGCCETLNQPGVGWSLEREAEDDQAWRYHFGQPRPIPADLAAAVGDVVHNLRSAMDNAAHYMAARHVQEAHSRDLTEEEEALTEFPIREDGQALNAWLSASRGKGTSKVYRHQLYGSQEVKALRSVQPFAIREEAGLLTGTEDPAESHQDLLTDSVYALNTIWNIDKHQRLPRLTWRVEIIYWVDEASVWHASVPERTVSLTDAQVIGTFRNNDGPGRPEEDPVVELGIHLDDHPYNGAALLTETLDRLHQSLASWVLPRMFWVADGNPPPLIISFGPPTPEVSPCQPLMR